MKNTEFSNRSTNKFIKRIFISISILGAAACVISCFHAKGGTAK